jgi:hypothetical protein
MFRSLISVGLRLGGVAGKFVAVVVLAMQSGTDQVGRFTLFFSAINLFVFVIGLDLYQFVIRELLARRSPAGRLRVLFGQQAFNACIYGLVLLLAIPAVAFSGGTIFEVPLWWFVLVLITDHAAQEMSRIFIVLSRPFHANVIYVAKTGGWAWIGAAIGLLSNKPLHAESFYPLWLMMNVGALIYGVLVLRTSFRSVRSSLPRH